MKGFYMIFCRHGQLFWPYLGLVSGYRSSPLKTHHLNWIKSVSKKGTQSVIIKINACIIPHALLWNFQRRNFCKEITEKSQNIIKQKWGLISSVVIGSGEQPSFGAIVLVHCWKLFKKTFSRWVAFHLWVFEKNKASTIPHFQFYD